jgi:exopolysaccharide biosynthesis protein
MLHRVETQVRGLVPHLVTDHQRAVVTMMATGTQQSPHKLMGFQLATFRLYNPLNQASCVSNLEYDK